MFRTWPTLNIFLYNIFGPSSNNGSSNSGDELYGVEPISYYIKNLFLNLNFLFPLAVCFCPVTLILTRLLTNPTTTASSSCANNNNQSFPYTIVIVIYACALLWIGILFKRPHKVCYRL